MKQCSRLGFQDQNGLSGATIAEPIPVREGSSNHNMPHIWDSMAISLGK